MIFECHPKLVVSWYLTAGMLAWGRFKLQQLHESNSCTVHQLQRAACNTLCKIWSWSEVLNGFAGLTKASTHIAFELALNLKEPRFASFRRDIGPLYLVKKTLKESSCLPLAHWSCGETFVSGMSCNIANSSEPKTHQAALWTEWTVTVDTRIDLDFA